jgi:hypothetical protein
MELPGCCRLFFTDNLDGSQHLGTCRGLGNTRKISSAMLRFANCFCLVILSLADMKNVLYILS